MSRPMTTTEREEFLAEPRVAVLAVSADDDGRPPLTVPVWYHYAPGGAVTFFTGTQGRRAAKSALIDAAGVLTVSVQQEQPPYRYVTVECDVVRVDRPPAPDDMLAVLRRYLSWDAAQGMVAAELGTASSAVILYTVRPTRWFSADFDDEQG